MILQDKNKLMAHARHYKLRSLLKMIRKALKLDRYKVANILNVNVNEVYYLEQNETMKKKISKEFLRTVCNLYEIDFEVIYNKMLNEHDEYARI